MGHSTRAMTTLGKHIQHARKRATLSLDRLAALADLPVDRVREIEAGTIVATPAEADRVALVFGVRVRDLCAGRAVDAPMRMLLREAVSGNEGVLEALAERRAIEELGEFQRWVFDAAELEALAGVHRRALPTSLHGDRERQARLLRLYTGKVGPIASMRAFVEALGVRVFFTTPEHLDARIDGASTKQPRAAILVNLVRGGACWWRTRMTLAHELAHVLFDLDGDRRTLFSPHIDDAAGARTSGRWRLFDQFDDLEAEADKFAACLLAPRDEIRALVGEQDPSSTRAISLVGQHFGVGRVVAVNRLQVCYGISSDERRQMLQRSEGVTWATRAFDDDAVTDATPRRSKALGDLVTQALASGSIDPLRAREFLRVPLHEALPITSLPDAMRAPVISSERRVRGVARRHLARAWPGRPLVDGPARARDDAWEIEALRWPPGAPEGTPERLLVIRGDAVVDDRPIDHPAPG